MRAFPASPLGVITDPELPARAGRLLRLPHNARAARACFRQAARRVQQHELLAYMAVATLIVLASAHPARTAAAAAVGAFTAACGLALTWRLTARARRRYRDRYVDLATLNDPAMHLIRRTQAAISQVLSARIIQDGQLDPDLNAAVLRRHEWDIALLLQQTAGLADEHQRIAAGPPSLAVDATAQLQVAILRQVTDATTRRVAALESYAGLVADANAAYLAWLRARQLAGLNSRFLDLLAAATGPDRHARADLDQLAGHAGAARVAFGGMPAPCDAPYTAEVTLPDLQAGSGPPAPQM
jgi:hypothetical protein